MDSAAEDAGRGVELAQAAIYPVADGERRQGRAADQQVSSRGDDAAAGIALACRAIHAVADGDEPAVLEALNGGTHAETAWAAAYLVSALRETARGQHRRPARAARALHAAADAMEQDQLYTRVKLLALDTQGSLA